MNQWEWDLLESSPSLESVAVDGVELKVGYPVRLRPRAGGDVLDLALVGRIATVEAIEQDYDGQPHLAVVLDDDPGRDLGLQRQPGHRFFFRPEEVETLPRILVAGIGNIFVGDDGFGVEVVQRLDRRRLPRNVQVADFGIRGFDLACAILDGPDIAIFVDACPRGVAPGTLHVIEPDLESLESDAEAPLGLEPHVLNPMNVLRLAKSMGGRMSHVVVVGCEPHTLGDEDGLMALSEPVAAAVNDAIPLIESLVHTLMRNGSPTRPDAAKETSDGQTRRNA